MEESSSSSKICATSFCDESTLATVEDLSVYLNDTKIDFPDDLWSLDDSDAMRQEEAPPAEKNDNNGDQTNSLNLAMSSSESQKRNSGGSPVSVATLFPGAIPSEISFWDDLGPLPLTPTEINSARLSFHDHRQTQVSHSTSWAPLMAGAASHHQQQPSQDASLLANAQKSFSIVPAKLNVQPYVDQKPTADNDAIELFTGVMGLDAGAGAFNVFLNMHPSSFSRQEEEQAKTVATTPAHQASTPHVLNHQHSTGENAPGSFRFEEVSPNDYLTGRGGHVARHPGNLRVRKIVVRLLKQYRRKDTSRRKKAEIVDRVVKNVRAHGGKILTRVAAGCWVECNALECHRKVSQRFREEASGRPNGKQQKSMLEVAQKKRGC